MEEDFFLELGWGWWMVDGWIDGLVGAGGEMLKS